MSESRTISTARASQRRERATGLEQHKAAIDRIIETAIYLQSESRRLAKEQCAKHGITASQLNALKLIESVGELSLSELSRKLSATNSAMTGMIDRMVAAELVTREQSAEDRRVWKIRLTSAGRKLARTVDLAPWEILRGAFASLPPADLERLIAMLSQVADNVRGVIAARTAKES